PQRTAVSSYTFRSRFVQTMKGAAGGQLGGSRLSHLQRRATHSGHPRGGLDRGATEGTLGGLLPIDPRADTFFDSSAIVALAKTFSSMRDPRRGSQIASPFLFIETTCTRTSSVLALKRVAPPGCIRIWKSIRRSGCRP